MAEGPIANLLGSSQQAGTKIPQHVLVVDSSGNPATFGGSGGTSAADSGTFTATSTLGTPVMGAYESTPDQLTSGQLGIIGLDVDRNVKVNVVAGGTAGTQYTEGDIDTSITGTASLMEAASNTLVPLQGTVADGLLVNLGSNNDVTVTGAVAVTDNSGSLTVDNATLSITGGGTESGALRVTLASDSTGVVSVDDNGSTLSIDDGGGSITVDGTVAVSGTVTVGAHAVTNVGTFAVQESGAALTALQLIDNLVLAEDAAHASGDPGVQLLSVRTDTASARGGTDGDYQPLITDGSGRLHVNVGNTVTVDTELPNAAALADDTSNPTAPAVGAFAHVWDGSTWDRQPGNSTEGTLVYTKRSLTASSPTTASVATSSGSAVLSNASRKGLHLRNTSTSGQRISLNLAGGTAVLDSGITLNVGDVYEMDEYGFTTAAITAISSASSGRLSVQEWT